MFNSMKIKLVVWFIAVFSIFFAGLEIFLYYELEHLVVSLADEHLKSEVETLANVIAVEEEHMQLESELMELASATTGVYAEKLSGHYYQIVSPDGHVLVRSPSLSLANVSMPVEKWSENPDYRTITGPLGVPLRMTTRAFKFHSGILIFQAGDSLQDTYKLLSSFRNIILAIFPLVFVLCGIGVYAITSLALRSLREFSGKIGQITEESLDERVREDGLVKELRPLAANFNTMLGRLEESFNRQRQFLSDASHELRTPTTIIKSFCDVTLSRERGPGDYKDVIVKISDTVNRMCDIINRILAVSRLDSKRVQFKPERMDLTDLMKDVVKLLEPSAASREIELQLDGKPVFMKGDRESLAQVFTNIVENAIKYNVPSGRIGIEVSEINGTASVRVEDTGVGIPAQYLEKVFDRFYRVDESRSRTVGSGLGLSIVKSVVDAHGGTIDVKSEVGKGSVFTVTLPLNLDWKNGHH